MADDIDELLDEAEDSLSHDSFGSKSTSSSKSVSSTRKVKNSKRFASTFILHAGSTYIMAGISVSLVVTQHT